MLHIRSVVLLPAVFLFLPFISFAGTGILEIHSEPSGARISIDDVDAGTTPYQNLEAPIGKHRVKAVLNPEYPPQVQDVLIDERSPKVIMFKFLERSRGAFTGQEIVRTTSKYKGSATFASVPTGALVVINGEPLKKPTPIGYTDVEVGRYRVEFLLEGRTLQAEFDVIHGETIKLIADFAAGKVINKWEKARPQQEIPKQEDTMREEAVRARQAPPAPPPPAQAPQTPPAPQTPAGSTDVRPQPSEGVPPYGELVITVNVRRDANLKYSDFFDIVFPKLPIESLSGPLFPAASTTDKHVVKDNFEYRNDAIANTRQFLARVYFASRDTDLAEGRANSTVMTVREGQYDLKVVRRRMVGSFYSVQKVLDAAAQEAIEIIRGNRLIVQIGSHMDGENKLQYEIKRTYENMAKKKSSAKATADQETSKTAGKQSNNIPVFSGIEN